MSLPTVNNSFEWREASWGPALTCGALGTVARHVFTSRHLELSELRSWMALAWNLGVAAGRVVRLKQVHSNNVIVMKKGNDLPEEPAEGDALISDDPSLALAIRMADCTPILLADRATGVVGAVHAGWRGTAAGAATETVRAMQAEFGSQPENLIAAIGPAIADCCYDVGSELVDEFAARGHERYLIDRWFMSPPPRRGDNGHAPLRLDLSGANRDQLVLAGVPENQIYISGLCTAIHLDVLTSFRAERGAAGRLAAVIRPATIQ